MIRKVIKTVSILFLYGAVVLSASCTFEREYNEPAKIVFAKDSHIWTASVGGSDPTCLTSEGVNASPSWSGDGTSIIFHSDRDGNDEIFIMNADGSGQKQLTSSASDTSRYPTWTPDGNIIFVLNQSGTYSFEIITPDGSFLKSVPATASPYELTVSRDGVFLADAYGPGTIQITDLSEGTQTDISPVGGRDCPQWNYDSSRIFYTDNAEIVYADIENPGVQNNFYTASGTVLSIVMGPAGRFLYYSLADGIHRLDLETMDSAQVLSETGISRICIQGRPR